MNKSNAAWEKQMQELVELNTMLARNHLLLEQDFIECLDLLFEMVYQACAVHPYGVKDCLDSMALRTNVEAMKYLANHGRLKITKEEGRRVFAVVLDDDTDKEVCLHSAPGKCCPEASCDYVYHKQNSRVTCSICGKVCEGCLHER